MICRGKSSLFAVLYSWSEESHEDSQEQVLTYKVNFPFLDKVRAKPLEGAYHMQSFVVEGNMTGTFRSELLVGETSREAET